MVWVGAIIVVLTFAAIIKKYETRLVLFISGVAMAAASGKPMAAVDAFSKAMVPVSVFSSASMPRSCCEFAVARRDLINSIRRPCFSIGLVISQFISAGV